MNAALHLLVVLCTVVAALVPHTDARAQDLGNVRVIVNLSDVKLGERFTVTVHVTHDPDMLVNVAPPERSAQVQLVEIRPRTSTVIGTEATTKFEYIMAAFVIGELQLQPFRVSWLRADGSTGSAITAPPTIAVHAVSQSNDNTLRPLKPQLNVAGAPPAWQRPAIYAATSVLASATVWAGVVWRLRRRKAAPEATTIDEATPEIEARRQLDTLAAADPLARGDYDTYYGTIAAVVRDYLEERFRFGARALTTTELQQRMVARGVERWQARLVAGLLDRCDGAVYAGRHPDPASADHDLTVAFEIVELSRPGEAVGMR